jgi:RNA polymerase sigma factor (sigma-70 family)
MDLFDKTDLFLSVIEMHKGIIYKVANSYCKDSQGKKDLVQEIILQLWKSFDSYNGQFKHSTWIYRIALNVAISYYRKEKRRKEISNPYSEGLFKLADFQESTELEGHTLFLQQFIADLKELDKALMLLYLEEKSHKEISEIIGITETNVATKIGRIKIILKQKFSKITM